VNCLETFVNCPDSSVKQSDIRHFYELLQKIFVNDPVTICEWKLVLVDEIFR